MIEHRKVNELINSYFSAENSNQIINDLQKYNWEQAEEKDIQDKKNVLLELIIKYKAYDTKLEVGFALENAEQPSSFYIRLGEIFESGHGIEISRIMANEISQLVRPIDRVVGLLSEHNNNECELTRERYHLAPIVGTLLNKPSCELINLQKINKKNKCDQFIKDGRLLPKENVVIIDEVLTTGTNIINAIEYVQKYHENVNISNAFVFVSRASEQKLKKIENKLKEYKVNLHYILDKNELVNYLYKKGLINEQELTTITKEV